LIKDLEKTHVVKDLNRVAILLRSVAGDGPRYFAALNEAGINYYAPRARAYFERDEVKTLIGALLYITDFLKQEGTFNEYLESYYEDCLDAVKRVKA
ncbi:unnamed protein product, partial [marine sediment metagenome]